MANLRPFNLNGYKSLGFMMPGVRFYVLSVGFYPNPMPSDRMDCPGESAETSAECMEVQAPQSAMLCNVDPE